MGEYKVGTISAILAKEKGNAECDPKVAALFGGSGGGGGDEKVFKMVKVKEEQIFVKKEKDLPDKLGEGVGGDGRKKKRKKEVKLKNREAAEIRVAVRNKVGGASGEGDGGKKGKKKKRVQEEAISSTTVENGGKLEEPVKTKKKKGKKAGEVKAGETGTEGDSKKRKKKKDRVVKVEETMEGDQEENEDEEESSKTVEETEKTVKTLQEQNAPKPKDPEQEARTIFVGNLPGDTERKAVRKLFKKWGQIETVRLRGGAPSKPTQLKKVAINKKELHKDKGTLSAYVRFGSREDAENAARQGKGLILKENHLVVDLAVKGDAKRDNKKAIFVGNLNLKVTDEELWRFFEDCGAIDSVRVVRDNATGLGKGFGYVNFQERDGVDLALKKNQQELKGRNLRISRCVKKLKVKKEPGQGQGGKAGGNQKGRKPGPGSKPGGRGQETNEFGGDKLAEIGKLKRKSAKPNRGEMKKVRLAKLLTGKAPPTTPPKPFNSHRNNQQPRPRAPQQKPNGVNSNRNAQNRKRYFN